MPSQYIVTIQEMYTATCGCKKNVLDNCIAVDLMSNLQNFASVMEINVLVKFKNRHKKIYNVISSKTFDLINKFFHKLHLHVKAIAFI